MIVKNISDILIKFNYAYHRYRITKDMTRLRIIARIYNRAIALILYECDNGVISEEYAKQALNILYERLEQDLKRESQS
jgi:hypothetical protein